MGKVGVGVQIGVECSFDKQSVSTPVSYLSENSSMACTDISLMGNDKKMQQKERPRESLSRDRDTGSNSKVKVANTGGESQVVKPMLSDTPSNSDMKFLVEFQSQVNKKLCEFVSKLKILEQLEHKVESVEKDISKMWSEIRTNHKEYDSKISHIDERVHGIEFSNSEAQEKLDNLTMENDKLKESLVYLQSQSMRNNLIFCNIEENEQPENTEQVIRNFIVEKMKVAEDLVREMRIERAHRMGPMGQRNHQRASA